MSKRSSFRYSLLLIAVFLMGFFFVEHLRARQLSEDVNFDGVVDVKDAVLLAEAFHSKPGDDHWNPNVDIVPDGEIDVFDAIRLSKMLHESLPFAYFEMSMSNAPLGTPIEFDPSESYDPDGAIVLYEWDFDGDGDYDISTTSPEIISHVYTILGSVDVTLKVTDNSGLTDTARDTGTVTPVHVIPEIPVGAILTTVSMLAGFATYIMFPRWRRRKEDR